MYFRTEELMVQMAPDWSKWVHVGKHVPNWAKYGILGPNCS